MVSNAGTYRPSGTATATGFVALVLPMLPPIAPSLGTPSSAMVHTTAIALLLRQAHLAAVYVEAAAELSHVVGHLFFWAARKVLTEYASPCPFSATIRERYFTAWSTPLTSSPSCIPSFTSTMTTPSSPESNTT